MQVVLDRGHRVLCKGFTLPLEQVVTGLGALELALHQPQRLARGEDGLSRLMVVSVVLQVATELLQLRRTPLPDMARRWADRVVTG